MPTSRRSRDEGTIPVSVPVLTGPFAGMQSWPTGIILVVGSGEERRDEAVRRLTDRMPDFAAVSVFADDNVKSRTLRKWQARVGRERVHRGSHLEKHEWTGNDMVVFLASDASQGSVAWSDCARLVNAHRDVSGATMVVIFSVPCASVLGTREIGYASTIVVLPEVDVDHRWRSWRYIGERFVYVGGGGICSLMTWHCLLQPGTAVDALCILAESNACQLFALVKGREPVGARQRL